MAALSVFIEDGVPPHLCANPVFVIAQEGDILIFEVLERDVSRLLKTLVGKPELYSLGGHADILRYALEFGALSKYIRGSCTDARSSRHAWRF
jgi:hypothetical protein